MALVNFLSLLVAFSLLFSLSLLSPAVASRNVIDKFLRIPGGGEREAVREQEEEDDFEFKGTKWALLIAGSAGYGNYRHQADVCHAYQLLRKGGLKEENIVVFMADDIAYNPENPYKGTIVNRPYGEDVYHGVPKDYTGRNVSVHNFVAALKGDRSAVRGGSGKVVASGPEDHVFVYYSDHGGPGILGMPTLPYLFANDIVAALVEKHANKGYKELVFYLEACESGSIFEGVLPADISVYATTASSAMESSWGTYCPGMRPAPPPEFETCLGDLYSVAWMEDGDVHNLAKESLNDQFKIVRERTSNHNTYEAGSHVMRYGDVAIDMQPTSFYMGMDPTNHNAVKGSENLPEGLKVFHAGEKMGVVSQRDADMLHLWHKYKNALEGSPRKRQALEEMNKMSRERSNIDRSIETIQKLISEKMNVLSLVPEEREKGLPLVDDWDCFKDMIRAYESKCGLLTQYGMKHTRVFANFCNRRIASDTVMETASIACDISMRPPTENGFFSA